MQLLLSNTLTQHRKKLNSAKAGGIKLPGFWHLWEDLTMTGVAVLDLDSTVTVEFCDKCSARAQVQVEFQFGSLWFCFHHYNKSAKALTEKGGVAKLLSSSRD
jgi:hypothetical protein